MKKKIFAIMLSLISLFLTTGKSVSVFAESKLAISSKSAYLIDYNTNTVLYSKNENERLPIASMTKLMLLYLTFNAIENNYLSLEEKILVSENAKNMGGSQVFLESNSEYLCSELIKSIIISSANDSSVAIAERLYGSESACVDAMNNASKELNLTNTLYSNCTGLPKPTQYSTAKDVAMLLKAVCSFEKYFLYSNIWLDKIKHPSGQETILTNTNKLVKFYNGCDGGKTGFTQEAGFCLSATAKRGNLRLIGVVINAENSKNRFNDVSTMFNYGFANYTETCVLEKGEIINEKVEVTGGVKNSLEIAVKDGFYIFGEKNKKLTYDYKIELKTLYAPIKKGQKVGVAKILKDNNVIGEVQLIANESISKKSFKNNIEDIASNW